MVETNFDDQKQSHREILVKTVPKLCRKFTGAWAYTAPDISSSGDSMVRSLTRSHDWFLVYGLEKKFWSSQEK